MTPEERRLIDGLFDRMRGYGAPEKDRDAEAVISQAVRAMPDAPYMLVQSVLAQEYALQEAGKRIEDLEAQVRALNDQAQRPAASSGGFLGGLLGGGRPAPDRATRVPPIGSRAGPSGVGVFWMGASDPSVRRPRYPRRSASANTGEAGSR